jgi:ABC-2 type transport system ATP-binding protein
VRAPEVLVLDEPTSGLDPMEMREIRSLLRSVSQDGVTVLLSSHLLTEVEQVCSHAVVMDRGRLVAAGTVAELIGARTAVHLEVDDTAAARTILSALTGVTDVTDEPPAVIVKLDGISRAEVVRALVLGGVGVETVTARHQLEDAFLGLLGEEH